MLSFQNHEIILGNKGFITYTYTLPIFVLNELFQTLGYVDCIIWVSASMMRSTLPKLPSGAFNLFGLV